jgi:hypothetical protein
MAALPEPLRQPLAGRYDLEEMVGRGGRAVVGGTHMRSRAIYQATVRNRLRTLEDLADRLVEQCEELAI